jgi:hypothetical protein
VVIAPPLSYQNGKLGKVYDVAHAEFSDLVFYPVFIGFHGVFRNPERLRNFNATFPLEDQVDNFFFLHRE